MEAVSKVNRFVAYLIDGIVSYIPLIILTFIAGATGIDALMYVGYAVCIAYLLLRDALTGGQSIGKKAMKYVALKEDGSSLAGDYGTSVIRNISLIIPIVSLVDAIFVLMDKPRLGDGWAKTKVENRG
jgi:uncharacterized RDD family membrane protein YckC